MPNTVGDKGQVVIEKPLRDALGIEPGFITVQTLIGDHLEIRFLPPEHNRSLRGVLSGSIKRSVSADELREAREGAWEEAARESWTSGRKGS